MRKLDSWFFAITAALISVWLFPPLNPLAQDADIDSPLVGQTWVRLGGPPGGMGYDIRMHPDDPDIMYVTDALAGVHVSTDGGATWKPSNEGITARVGSSGDSIPVFSLTIDPNNPNIIWIGLLGGGEVYRSDDGGATWESYSNGIVEGQALTMRGFTIQSGNSDVVYAAGEISSWYWAGEQLMGRNFECVQGVVYKTTDRGESWTAIWRGDSLARYVIIDPRDADTLYVSTGIFDRESANTDIEAGVPGGVGVLKSSDGGVTWRQMNNGLDDLYIGSLVMHPENPLALLAAAGNSAHKLGGGGVYKTTDGGEHWYFTAGDDGNEMNSVEFATSDPDIAYAGGYHALYRSFDGGETWESILPERGTWGPDGVRGGIPIDFQVDPRDPYRIFANNYGGGNFLSEDGGLTWVSASQGYTGAELTDVAVSKTNPAVVYANGRSGPFRSTDGGVTWVGINPQWEGLEINEGARVAVSPVDPAQIIVSSAQGGLTYFSSDSGTHMSMTTNWHSDMSALPELQSQQGMQAIVFAPSDPWRVYGGFGIRNCAIHADDWLCEVPLKASLFHSEDGGVSWTPINDTVLEGLSITAFAVHPERAEVVWAATAGGGIFYSSDGGSSWMPKSDGLPTNKVMDLVLDPTDPNILYAATAANGVYKTTDGGDSWRAKIFGMDPNEPILSVVVDPQRSNVLYASSLFSGVYLSQDGGEIWRLLNQGLRTRAVSALSISSDGKTLYAATQGEGLYRLSTLSQGDFDELAPSEKAALLRIKVDGHVDDWADRGVLHEDPTGDAEDGFLDLTSGYAFLTAESLYFAVETDNPQAPVEQFDITLQLDGREIMITLDPRSGMGFFNDFEGIGISGRAAYSDFAFGDALEGRVDLRDLNFPAHLSIVRINAQT